MRRGNKVVASSSPGFDRGQAWDGDLLEDALVPEYDSPQRTLRVPVAAAVEILALPYEYYWQIRKMCNDHRLSKFSMLAHHGLLRGSSGTNATLLTRQCHIELHLGHGEKMIRNRDETTLWARE